jgi:hypothetical protein
LAIIWCVETKKAGIAMMGERDSFLKSTLPVILLAALLSLPYMFEIRGQSIYSELSYSLIAYTYTIATWGITLLEQPIRPYVLFGHIYDTILYFIFILAIAAYYDRKVTYRNIKILGVLTILPRLVPTCVYSFFVFVLWGGHHLHLSFPLPFVTIIGLIAARRRPSIPEEDTWLEENER